MVRTVEVEYETGGVEDGEDPPVGLEVVETGPVGFEDGVDAEAVELLETEVEVVLEVPVLDVEFQL